jgi:hypothetical protein
MLRTILDICTGVRFWCKPRGFQRAKGGIVFTSSSQGKDANLNGIPTPPSRDQSGEARGLVRRGAEMNDAHTNLFLSARLTAGRESTLRRAYGVR